MTQRDHSMEKKKEKLYSLDGLSSFYEDLIPFLKLFFAYK